MMDQTAIFYSQPTYVQRGAGLPVYSGSRRQRGGSILGSLKSMVMPFFNNIKNAAINRAKQGAWNLAKGVAWDTIRGKNVVDSVKSRGIHEVKELGKGTLSDVTGIVTAPIKRKRQAIRKKLSRPLKRRKVTAKNF